MLKNFWYQLMVITSLPSTVSAYQRFYRNILFWIVGETCMLRVMFLMFLIFESIGWYWLTFIFTLPFTSRQSHQICDFSSSFFILYSSFPSSFFPSTSPISPPPSSLSSIFFLFFSDDPSVLKDVWMAKGFFLLSRYVSIYLHVGSPTWDTVVYKRSLLWNAYFSEFLKIKYLGFFGFH